MSHTIKSYRGHYLRATMRTAETDAADAERDLDGSRAPLAAEVSWDKEEVQ